MRNIQKYFWSWEYCEKFLKFPTTNGRYILARSYPPWRIQLWPHLRNFFRHTFVPRKQLFARGFYFFCHSCKSFERYFVQVMTNSHDETIVLKRINCFLYLRFSCWLFKNSIRLGDMSHRLKCTLSKCCSKRIFCIFWKSPCHHVSLHEDTIRFPIHRKSLVHDHNLLRKKKPKNLRT